MANELVLNEDERDCLQELMNISYGSATAAIAEIIDKFATLNIPSIETLSISEFKKHLSKKLNANSIQYVTNQLISGSLSGETMFIMNEESTFNLASEFDLDDDEMDEDELKDVVLEISNIITSTTLGKLAELVETTISFSPPSINIIKSFDDLDDHYTNEYNHIIIISTDIKFEEQNIKGELLILSKDNAIMYLKDALNKMLDEF